MKKVTLKDIKNILFLISSFIVFVFIIANFKYYYGSTVDWLQQHIAFPEYFRLLFYKTKNLFPDFALNIGAGQNIYNFSYYGLLSPVILISYLFPFVKMIDYIIISTLLTITISVILLYFWLKNKNLSDKTILLSCFLFLFATPLTFHSHRHIMFITYMPFLIMGLYGVDKKLNQNKSILLSLSVFLMIMTSYYYSIGGILSLIIYGVFKYIKDNEKITFKNFIKDGFKFVIPIIIGIICSSIIILPTFSVILNSRGETFTTITIKDLIIPKLNMDFYLYDPYGVGLTSIAIIAIINLFTKQKENIFLGIILSTSLLFPLFNYILNATMYIDAKALIPFLPLLIIAISIFIEDVFEKRINYNIVLPIFLIITIIAVFTYYRYILYLIDVIILLICILLYKKFKNEDLFIIPIMLFTFIMSISMSFNDEYVDKKLTIKDTDNITYAINYITANDKSFYRISNNMGNSTNNKIYNNINNYNTTIYSSTYNIDYNKFFYDVMNNNVPSRNRVITTASNNILFDIFMNNKYLINKTKSKKNLHGYELINRIKAISIYKSKNTLPLGYANSKLMSEDDFQKLEFPNSALALLNNIVVPEDTTNEFTSELIDMPFNENNLKTNNLLIEINKKNYSIYSTGKGTMKYTLDDEFKDKIIFVEFTLLESPSCSLDDISITINGNKNKLTCKEWKYHNQNYTFNYVIADENLSSLNIKFSDGTFKINNLKLYALDYEALESVSKKVDPLNIKTIKENSIEGDIKVTKDGYFTLSIPYQKGFKAYVDGKEVPIVKVNTSFIGFKIFEGNHDIKIVYNAPFKRISLAISTIGFLILGILTFIENKNIKRK